MSDETQRDLFGAPFWPWDKNKQTGRTTRLVERVAEAVLADFPPSAITVVVFHASNCPKLFDQLMQVIPADVVMKEHYSFSASNKKRTEIHVRAYSDYLERGVATFRREDTKIFVDHFVLEALVVNFYNRLNQEFRRHDPDFEI